MTLTFEPLTRSTLSKEVRELLLKSILSGRFPPGSVLPAERTLSSELGVARTSVREALQGLISTGVIERRGNRACVVETLPDLDFDVSSQRKVDVVRQLFEVRRIVELPAVRLAAERATADQRTEIMSTAALTHTAVALHEFRALDRRFHALISRAAGNPFLAEVELKILESLMPSSDSVTKIGAGDSAGDRRIVRQSSAAHKAIAEAILAHDSAAASEAAERHLTEVEAWMLTQVSS